MDNCKNIYPTIGLIKIASFETLETWSVNLPPPQTDVERTVMKRIDKMLFERIAKKVKETEPEIASKWNELADRLKGYSIDMDKM